MTPDRLQQIEDLFHAARACGSDEREALLAAADPELRREVESLLAQRGDPLLDRPVLGLTRSDTAAVTQVAAGTELGPYTVETMLGRGGMGEVYRARDTRLNRRVAIKVSSHQFTDRFEREARAIAALNHPHICTLYDVGPNCLVMELVEGETLAARLKRGKLSMEQTIQYGAQIADALAAAHAKGIIHRDLKPGNIMLTKSGVKVLDFGLAKSSQDETLTATNAVMGTPAYMAPEQRGRKECDARTDIYSLGLVLREMATGNTVHGLTDLLPQFAHIVERCLMPDPENRWQTASDVKAELEWVGKSHGTLSIPNAPRRPLPWAAAAAFAVAFTAVSFLYFRGTYFSEVTPEARVISTIVPQPENIPFVWNQPLLSPDGRRIVLWELGTDGKIRHWVRSLDGTAATQPLPEGAIFPFWSPDSRSLGFFADGKLKRIDVTGGPSVTLADAPSGCGGSWSPQGVIVFAPTNAGGLQQVPAAGGPSKPATTLHGTGDYSHRLPWFLPDGRHFLFQDQAQGVITGSTLRIGSVDAIEAKTVGPANSQGVYSSGHLLFLRERTLMAQPFDEARLVTTGDAVPIAEQVQRFSTAPSPLGGFSVSRERLLAYQTEPGGGRLQLTWFESGGKQVGTLGDASEFLSIEFSPDHRSLAATRSDPNTSLWIYEMARGLATRFTSGSEEAATPVWSPDGLSIIYRFSSPAGGVDLYRKAINAEGTGELLYSDGASNTPTSWSPDGRFLLFTRIDPKTGGDIWVLPLERGAAGGPLKPFPWLATDYNEGDGRFSPDGRWVVYGSNENTPQLEIYVAPFPGPGGRRRISAGEGRYPRWRADGKEIFYSRTDGMLMAVDVSLKSATIEVGSARPLGIRIGFVTTGSRYDVSADGQRFLVARPLEQKASAPLMLVENWTELLKKK